MNVQWYPGHMTKARRMMEEDIRLVDLVIEILDARAPFSSQNPDIDELGRNKSRLILLNKADLAEEKVNLRWEEYFKEKGCYVVKTDSRSGADIKAIHRVIEKACQEKTERDRKRGILNRPVRAMVVGIPNVGKSTFINTFAGKACTKTGNRPGVTKGKQWIRLNKKVELLDTPGILWPKFEDQKVGLRLAWIGSIRDEIMNTTELALELMRFFDEKEISMWKERYQTQEKEPVQLLEAVARSRACLLKGGEYDMEKAAALFLEDYRSGRLGRITLELPG